MKTRCTRLFGYLSVVLLALVGARTCSKMGSTASGPTNMALVPAGSFLMGDTFNEGWSAELPTNTVTVSGFYMDRTEVTLARWREVRDWATVNGYAFDNAGSGRAGTHPVQTVSWHDVVKWCNARSEKEGRTPAYYTDAAMTLVYRTGQVAPCVRWDRGYRLPTEAEWEKATRGGLSGKRFPWGDTISHSHANYHSDMSYGYDISPTRGKHPRFDGSRFVTIKGKLEPLLRRLGYRPAGNPAGTSPAGYFEANGYGLYDLTGNVLEWCWDWYGSYPSASQADPRGPATGSGRVIRGGSWGSIAVGCRVTYRFSGADPNYRDYFLGFRSVLPSSQP
jgi:formylglycine-generating enzyme required for sulfatase activity